MSERNDMIGQGLARVSFFILASSALIKFISAFQSAPYLLEENVLFGTTERTMLLIGAGVEVIVLIALIASKKIYAKHLIIAWIASCFVFYRLGTIWIKPYKPCICLGSAYEWLNISPDGLDAIARVLLFYLLTSSFGFLFYFWHKNHGSHQKDFRYYQNASASKHLP